MDTGVLPYLLEPTVEFDNEHVPDLTQSAPLEDWESYSDDPAPYPQTLSTPSEPSQLDPPRDAATSGYLQLSDDLEELLAGSYSSHPGAVVALSDILQAVTDSNIQETGEADEALASIVHTVETKMQDLGRAMEQRMGLMAGNLSESYRRGSEWDLDGKNPLVRRAHLMLAYPVAGKPSFRGGAATMQHLGRAGLWELYDTDRLAITDTHNHAHPAGKHDPARPNPARDYYPGEHEDLHAALEQAVVDMLCWKLHNKLPLFIVAMGESNRVTLQRASTMARLRNALGYDFDFVNVAISARPTESALEAGCPGPALMNFMVAMPCDPTIPAALAVLLLPHPSWFLYSPSFDARHIRGAMATDKGLAILRYVTSLSTTSQPCHFTRFVLQSLSVDLGEEIWPVIHQIYRDYNDLDFDGIDSTLGYDAARRVQLFYDYIVKNPEKTGEKAPPIRRNNFVSLAWKGMHLLNYRQHLKLRHPVVGRYEKSCGNLGEDGRPILQSGHQVFSAGSTVQRRHIGTPSEYSGTGLPIGHTLGSGTLDGRPLQQTIIQHTLPSAETTKKELLLPYHLSSSEPAGAMVMDGRPLQQHSRQAGGRKLAEGLTAVDFPYRESSGDTDERTMGATMADGRPIQQTAYQGEIAVTYISRRDIVLPYEHTESEYLGGRDLGAAGSDGRPMQRHTQQLISARDKLSRDQMSLPLRTMGSEAVKGESFGIMGSNSSDGRPQLQTSRQNDRATFSASVLRMQLPYPAADICSVAKDGRVLQQTTRQHQEANRKGTLSQLQLPHSFSGQCATGEDGRPLQTYAHFLDGGTVKTMFDLCRPSISASNLGYLTKEGMPLQEHRSQAMVAGGHRSKSSFKGPVYTDNGTLALLLEDGRPAQQTRMQTSSQSTKRGRKAMKEACYADSMGLITEDGRPLYVAPITANGTETKSLIQQPVAESGFGWAGEDGRPVETSKQKGATSRANNAQATLHKSFVQDGISSSVKDGRAMIQTGFQERGQKTSATNAKKRLAKSNKEG